MKLLEQLKKQLEADFRHLVHSAYIEGAVDQSLKNFSPKEGWKASEVKKMVENYFATNDSKDGKSK